MGTRDSYLQVRISATEKAELERRARRAGQDVSTYVRSRLLPITRDRVQALVDRLRRDPDSRRYSLAELNDLLTDLPPAHLESAIDELDVTGLTLLLQNYVTAMVEQATHEAGLRAPGWTTDVPRLAEPWFAVPFRSLRPHLLKEAPVAFKRRNLFVDAAVGDRV
ncbi:MAG TPA: hypothetical protein VMM79_07290 [Longimicrobiales bacterium]|nr:hypothetical protein [Longimicrobiales bacterium]